MTSSEAQRVTLLMETTNRRVAENAKPGVNQYSGWLAAIRLGISPATEIRAEAAAAPFVAGLDNHRRSAALRGAAIRAINKDVTHSPAMTLGRSFSWLASRAAGTSVAEQVDVLPQLNVNSAALVLDGLVGRCGQHDVPVDFLDLATTLIWWGKAERQHDQQRRNTLVLDFYQSASTAN